MARHLSRGGLFVPDGHCVVPWWRVVGVLRSLAWSRRRPWTVSGPQPPFWPTSMRYEVKAMPAHRPTVEAW